MPEGKDVIASLNDTKAARREEILWEELRSIRDLLFRILQWGVTVLASLQTALFFLRKEIKDSMVGSNQLKMGEPLPLERYLVGTIILCVVSVICCYLVYRVSCYYRNARKQLIKENTESFYYEIKQVSINNKTRYAIFFVFLAFPILDIGLRIWVQLHIHIICS